VILSDRRTIDDPPAGETFRAMPSRVPVCVTMHTSRGSCRLGARILKNGKRQSGWVREAFSIVKALL